MLPVSSWLSFSSLCQGIWSFHFSDDFSAMKLFIKLPYYASIYLIYRDVNFLMPVTGNLWLFFLLIDMARVILILLIFFISFQFSTLLIFTSSHIIFHFLLLLGVFHNCLRWRVRGLILDISSFLREAFKYCKYSLCMALVASQ